MSDQDKRLGVYFHIPFCASKCAYCDFCSLPGRDKLMPYYQDALLIQLQETMPRMTDYFIDTVYFGGGTPSYYGARRIVEILQELKVTNRLMKQSEITVECNPDSVNLKMLQTLRKAGANRISLGVQSAHPCELRSLHRPHDFEQVKDAVKAVRAAKFKNLSAWERKLIEGPYIHHMAEIEGDYTEELREFTKYVKNVTLDTVQE